MDSRNETPVAAYTLHGLLIAGADREVCRRLGNMFIDSGYTVTVTDSASSAVNGVLKGAAQVVLLGSELEGRKAAELIPILKSCKPNLHIILVSGDAPLPMLRRVRREGIFYHALRPVTPDDVEEIREAVRCAFEKTDARREMSLETRGTTENRTTIERRVS